MYELAKKSKKASRVLRGLDNSTRKKMLLKLADHLDSKTQEVISENRKDMDFAEKSDLSQALKDRLMLDEGRVKAMVQGVREIAEQDDIVGGYSQEFKNDEGLTIKRQRIPLGVILMIFESRPNVVIDCAALALKSSNAILLKGGKEAKHSNEILGKIIQESISEFVPQESVQVLASDSREEVNALLSMEDCIDVVIPRGGERLIEHVYKNAKMPVIAHFKGLCHMYIDSEADDGKAVDLVLNAKTHRTGVCNAIETLLIHKDKLASLAGPIAEKLKEKETDIRADEAFSKASGQDLKTATDEDWATEYLSNTLSIKTVDSMEDAIEHINEYGTFHTEAIISENQSNCEKFLLNVDASCIAVNASTRFNDGGQLGLGAELGISTTKFHAYGPMGAEQMTTTRYVIVGEGHTRK